jgi:hypothetical protein
MRLAAGRVFDDHKRLAGNARLLRAWATRHDGPTRAAELVEQLGGHSLPA